MVTQEEVNKATIPLAIGLILIVIGFWLGGLMTLGFLLIGLACILPMIRLFLEEGKREIEDDKRKKSKSS